MSDIKILSNVLEAVMLRPSMYIGQLHLDRFQCFVCSYICGHGNDRQEWYDFAAWVGKKYRRSPAEPCTLIANKFG